MPNSSNSNSYLILYLIIILVLIYAITFMSSYTCNISVQPNEPFKSKEKFSNYDYDDDEDENYNEDHDNSEYYPNGVPNYPYEDFEVNSDNSTNFKLITVGADKQLYSQDIINNNWTSTMTLIPNSGSVSDICSSSTGGLYGIGTDNLLYSKSNLNATWNQVKISVNLGLFGWQNPTFSSVSMLNDGHTLLLLPPLSNLNSFFTYDTTTIGTSDIGQVMTLQNPAIKFVKIIQLQNGQFYGVGVDTKFYLGTGAINNIVWTLLQTNNCCGISATQLPNGSIAVIGTGNNIWTTDTIGGAWVEKQICCYYSLTTLPIAGVGTLSAAPITQNDYTIVLTGTNNQLYVQDIINNVWYENSALVQNSGYVMDIYVAPNGLLLGIGLDHNLWTRSNLNAVWNKTKLDGSWNAVSLANDNNTLVLVGQDNYLWTAQLNSLTTAATQINKELSLLKVIQLQNGQLYGVGTDNKFYLGSGPLTDIVWTVLATNSGYGKSVSQAPDGSLLVIGTDNTIWRSLTIGGVWTQVKTSNNAICCYIALAVMQIPPQTINNYSRKGAFNDSSTRTIPNYLGTFNTLPECINSAQQQGYNTVGYQYMNNCFGGNNSAYDSLGFQNDNTLNVSAYPGSWTNIVYKTTSELVTIAEPNEGEVFLYQACQFGGSGSKMTIGQYPNLNDSVDIKSIKLGINTKLTLYTLANFQGTNNVYYGYSDTVNKDSACIDFTFVSAKVEKYQNALPSKPSDLTNEQLASMWTQAGCKAGSVGYKPTSLTYWRSLKTIADITADMKAWATDNDPVHKEGCYTLAPQPNVPAEGEVVLFENCDFGGRYKKFGMGNVAFVGTDFNDITSSIKIGPYTSITIYESINFGSKSASWKNDSDIVSNVTCLTANNFNNMLSSLKVTSSTAQVNYSLDIRSNPVSIAGPWNTAPWGMTKFVDQNAQWIWYTKNSTQGAPVDTKPVRFQLLVPITGNRDIPVVIHVIADNAPQGANFIKVNGQLVGQITEGGWVTPNYTQIQTALAPGSNLVEFDVQNSGGAAGLLVSIINSDTFEVVADSGTGQWGWVDPSKVISAILSEEIGSEFVIHDEAQKGKIVSFKNLGEISQMMVGGTFRLSMNLTSVPPYIKGQQYKNGDTNKFYLSIEKIDPNCQIQENGKCMNIYVDNNKCANATLSNVSRSNAYRLVIVSAAYVLDASIPFGKNVDFTLVKVGEKVYLKNVQTGYMPKLFLNDYKQKLYGYMDTNYLSNINSLKSNQNKLCGSNVVPPAETENENEVKSSGIFGKAVSGIFGTNEQTGPKADQKFVNCTTNADGSMYMMTTTNLVESNPVKFVINKDGTISIRLQQYNSYGNIEKTYSLISCNFNVNTYAFIEKLTNPLGTFLVNMACFDPDDNRQLPKNTLNFSVEMSKYPDSYLKDKNIYNLNT